MQRPKMKNSVDNIIENLIAQLSKIELLEDLYDPYASEKLLPILKDNEFSKKLGALSLDRLKELIKLSLDNPELKNKIKWSHSFFGQCLPSQISLTSFLEGTVQSNVKESFYTNYKILTEEDKSVAFGDSSGSILITQDSSGLRSYSKVTNKQNLYIAAIKSNNYRSFLQAAGNPSTREGLKIKEFASSIAQTVSELAIKDIEAVITSENDRLVLNELKNKLGSFPVLADSIVLGIVDVLNLGTFTTAYGPTKKAGWSLYSHQILNEPQDTNSLLDINPNIADDIKQKINTVLEYTNPYADIRNIQRANSKARTNVDIYGTAVNVLFTNFSNIASAIGNMLGNTKIDLDDYVTISKEQKINKIYDFIDYTPSTTAINNNFIRFVLKELSNVTYAFSLDIASGFKITKSNKKTSDKSGTIDFETLRAPEQIYKDSKPALYPKVCHDYIIRLAQSQYGDNFTVDNYLQELSSLDTKSERVQTAGQGKTKLVKEQLLNIIRYVYNDATNELTTPFILFASVPKIMLIAAKYNMLVCDNVNTIFPGSVGESAISFINNMAIENVLSNHRRVSDKFIPMSQYVEEYMSILLNEQSSEEDLKGVKQRFMNLIKYMASGYWTIDSFDGRLGLVNPFTNTAELGIRSDCITGEWSALHREARGM